MFVLDTNVISEMRKAGDGRADANVTTWIARQDTAGFFVSAVTLMELQIGVLQVERRDPLQGARLRTWLDRHFLPEFTERTLPIDATVALQCTRLHVPDRHRSRDGRRHPKRRRL
jgi:predicted nucleic acid-binding protein